MNNTLLNFYKDFYGEKFARYFRRPSDFKLSRIQYMVETPKQLYLHIHRNSGFHPCYTSVYNYGSSDNLKQNLKSEIILDRVFFDFDVELTDELFEIKKELQYLRRPGLKNWKQRQNECKELLKISIIENRLAEPAINEAKFFAEKFQESFGNYPALFFSGFKGCHAYTFFRPFKLLDPNFVIYNFSESIKKFYKLRTLDLAVNKDALSRLARVPYSKHQLTDLAVVPFNINDSYDEIISKSIKPNIEFFNSEKGLSNFDNHLKNLEDSLKYKYDLKPSENKNCVVSVKLSFFKNLDHRQFFSNILGEPVRYYPEKKYVMYNCPFPDHEDIKPSFRVHKAGYYCYSCQRKGNYWQFLKDYNGWTDEKVKKFLKSLKNGKNVQGGE